MLKKNDLAKQFELVVTQEIKNYNDSLNYILDSIRNLRDSIELVHQESLENHALLLNLQNDMGNQISSLTENYQKLAAQFLQFTSDQRVINERNSKEMIEMASFIYQKISEEKKNDQKIKNLDSLIFKLRADIQSDRKSVNDTLDQIFYKFQKEISKAKQEILNTPTEASIFKNELEEQIASYKIDVKGIMRELNVYKADNVITQKKIENIYTLIERLTKKIEVK